MNILTAIFWILMSIITLAVMAGGIVFITVTALFIIIPAVRIALGVI